jgi:hypothetical protein
LFNVGNNSFENTQVSKLSVASDAIAVR